MEEYTTANTRDDASQKQSDNHRCRLNSDITTHQRGNENFNNPNTTPDPVISAIIPLYNKKSYIRRAIDSVLAQTVQNFELIVVNDGSTDGSETIVGEYSDSRIRLINQKNQGVSVARNSGVGAAKAELVAFLDADDEWLPEFLENILILRKKYPKAGIYGTAHEFIYPGNNVVKYIYPTNEPYVQFESYFTACLSLKAEHMYTSSSIAFVKKYFIEVGGYTPGVKWSEGTLLAVMFGLRYPFVAYSDTVCSRYYKYTENNSTSAGRSEYLFSPASKYLDSIPPDCISGRPDYDGIIFVRDFQKLSALSNNINSCQDSRKIRSSLKEITHPYLKKRKYKIYLLSYLPNPCIKLINKHSKQLSAIKWKLKTMFK